MGHKEVHKDIYLSLYCHNNASPINYTLFWRRTHTDERKQRHISLQTFLFGQLSQICHKFKHICVLHVCFLKNEGMIETKMPFNMIDWWWKPCFSSVKTEQSLFLFWPKIKWYILRHKYTGFMSSQHACTKRRPGKMSRNLWSLVYDEI